MISRTLLNPVEDTVPPVPLTLEEFRLGELPSLGGVGHEHGFQRAILTAQALDDPEEKGLGQLAVTVDMLPDTSSMKNTTACTAGWRRRASCR